MFLLFTGMYLPITFVYCIKTNVAFAEMEKQGTVEYDVCYKSSFPNN